MPTSLGQCSDTGAPINEPKGSIVMPCGGFTPMSPPQGYSRMPKEHP